jgi:hypothetical protein
VLCKEVVKDLEALELLLKIRSCRAARARVCLDKIRSLSSDKETFSLGPLLALNLHNIIAVGLATSLIAGATLDDEDVVRSPRRRASLMHNSRAFIHH